MKFKKFISEENLSLEDKCKIIKKYCSQYLKEAADTFLFHGQNSIRFENETHDDRKNKNTFSMSVNLFNLYVEEKYGRKHIRNANAVFATSDRYDADMYGKVFYFFPEDGYEYIWSLKIVDFMGYDHKIWEELFKKLREKYGIRSDLKNSDIEIIKIIESLQTQLRVAKNPTLEYVNSNKLFNDLYKIVRPSVIEILDEKEYQTSNLKTAIESKREIIFTVKKYYLIRPEEVLDRKTIDSINFKNINTHYQDGYKKLLEMINEI